MPGAKGNLFCTSSMPRVTVSVDSTSIQCETESGAYKDILQCAHPLRYCCYSQETPVGFSLIMRTIHIWLLD